MFSGIRNLIFSRPSQLPAPPQPTGPFSPTYDDVTCARALLKTLKLPTELVLEILDQARYWPTYHSASEKGRSVKAAASIRQSASAAICLEAGIFDNPICNAIRSSGERFKLKSIEFDIMSRDQGWTSERTQGTFETSSWLEASIVRMSPQNGDIQGEVPPREINVFTSHDNQEDDSDPEIDEFTSPLDFQSSMPDRCWYLVKRPEHALQGPQDDEGDLAWYVQGNRVAFGLREYRVVWSVDGLEGNDGAGRGEGFLEALQDRDRMVVWARAKWPGWQCVVDSIKVTVRYGF